MTTTTNGKWSFEAVDSPNGYRLSYDGRVMIESVPDADDLFYLFAVSMILEGFACIADRYHQRAMHSDEGDLEFIGPGCVPIASSEILSFCRGGIGELRMPDSVCAHLGLPCNSTYSQGVDEFHRGYSDHSLPPPARRTPSNEERERIGGEHRAGAATSSEQEAFILSLRDLS